MSFSIQLFWKLAVIIIIIIIISVPINITVNVNYRCTLLIMLIHPSLFPSTTFLSNVATFGYTKPRRCRLKCLPRGLKTVLWLPPHFLHTVYVCTPFCARCWDISQDEWKPWSAGGAKSQRITKSVGFVIWAPLMSVPACFTAFHPVIVKTFRYGPKRWSDQQTDIKIPRAMLLVGSKRVEALSHKNMLL